MNVVGVMSGTSLDGVDFVLCDVSAQKINFKERAFKRFPLGLKNRLETLAEGKMNYRESCKLHYELGEFYYKSLKKIKQDKKWKVDLIGLHGQTVYHFPPQGTIQIGEPTYLTQLGADVVCDFRSKLLVYKTQGAPLAPVLHEFLLKKEKSWGFLNLGGMSNLTLKLSGQALFASDFGPANVFLDRAVKDIFNKDYDKGGALSLRGLPDVDIVESYVKSHPYFKKKHAKSCGREEFSEKEYKKLMKKMSRLSHHDKLSTFCEISLYPILQYLKGKKLSKLVVSGGGAKNNYFIKRLKESLSCKVITSEEMGWPVEAIEGGAFALLAYKRFKNQKVNFEYLGLKEKSLRVGSLV